MGVTHVAIQIGGTSVYAAEDLEYVCVCLREGMYVCLCVRVCIRVCVKCMDVLVCVRMTTL